MSCNFGEIIRKLYSLWKWAKPSRHSRLPPPPTSSQVATADFPRGGEKCASCRRRFHSPDLLARWRGRAGWSANRCHSITDHRIWLKFNMKMDNGVLLLCYLDKICLKGSQSCDSPSVDYTTFYRQHLCVNEGSRPQQHTWNSNALFFPAQIYCCT